jgi:hypothetical protein
MVIVKISKNISEFDMLLFVDVYFKIIFNLDILDVSIARKVSQKLL